MMKKQLYSPAQQAYRTTIAIGNVFHVGLHVCAEMRQHFNKVLGMDEQIDGWSVEAQAIVVKHQRPHAIVAKQRTAFIRLSVPVKHDKAQFAEADIYPQLCRFSHTLDTYPHIHFCNNRRIADANKFTRQESIRQTNIFPTTFVE